MLAAADGRLDKVGGGVGGVRAALGEGADFVGAGGFNGGIEGEEVGLKGDGFDDLDEVGDFGLGGADGLHGAH